MVAGLQEKDEEIVTELKEVRRVGSRSQRADGPGLCCCGGLDGEAGFCRSFGGCDWYFRVHQRGLHSQGVVQTTATNDILPYRYDITILLFARVARLYHLFGGYRLVGRRGARISIRS